MADQQYQVANRRPVSGAYHCACHITYSATHFIGGNGFLAIYISAIILGNSNFIHKRSLIKFYDCQAWLMQIILFLTLGLLIFLSRIVPVIGMGLLISAFLIFVALPAGVFISLAFFKTNFRSKVFLSRVGLSGGVPIVFATYPLINGLSRSDTIFNLVFFISVTSVLLQGTTLAYVARLLHLDVPSKTKRRTDFEIADDSKKEKIQIFISSGNSVIGKMIVQLDLPKGVQIMTIGRNNDISSRLVQPKYRRMTTFLFWLQIKAPLHLYIVRCT